MRLLLCLLIVFIINLAFPASGEADPAVSAEHAILIEQSTGRILFEKKAHEKSNIASITKIMTAIIAIESGKMEEMSKTSRKAVYTEGSSIYLEQGEEIKLSDLVYGLMLRSGNDAAVAIAEHVGGSEEGFVYLMNEKALWLGMTNTHFDNPHGLDSDTHYSSAYDMALLMQYAMGNKHFQEITGAKTFKSANRTYSWRNKNKLLTQIYEYCTGGKTGYTKKTGRTLVSTASKDGMDLIAVTLNAPDDWRDHTSLFEWAFEKYDVKTISDKGKKTYSLLDSGKTVTGFLHEIVSFPISESEQGKVKSENFLLERPHKDNEGIIGKAVFYLDDRQIIEAAIHREPPEDGADASRIGITEVFMKTVGWK